MTDEQIKDILAIELNGVSGIYQRTIRRIIFSKNNTIDWQEAWSIMNEEMPELESKYKNTGVGEDIIWGIDYGNDT